MAHARRHRRGAAVEHVPGAFELPLAARALALQGEFDAVVALGCVIRGDTAHFEFVAGECAHGLQRVMLDTGVPVSFGVLTVDTRAQALRARGAGLAQQGWRGARRPRSRWQPAAAAEVSGRSEHATPAPARWRVNSRCRRCIAGSSTAANGRTWCPSSRPMPTCRGPMPTYFQAWSPASAARTMNSTPRSRRCSIASRPSSIRSSTRVLLIGSYELQHRPEVPFRVVINEAVSLARRFGATDGHKFVNGVLDRAARLWRIQEH